MPYTIETKDGIVISDIPDDVPRDSPLLRQQVAKIRAERTGGAGMAMMEQAGLPTMAGQVGLASAAPEATPSAPAEPTAEPETTAGGVAGAALRGAAPQLFGAVVGAPLGAAGARVGAATMDAIDTLITLTNAVTGKEITSPSMAAEELLTYLGVPEPKTQAEKMVRTIAQGAASGAATSGAGTVIKSLAPAASRLAKVGAAMEAAPLAQAAMGATGGAGAELGGMAAQEYGYEPGSPEEAAARLTGGVLGGMAGGKAVQAAQSTITPAAVSPERQTQVAQIMAGEAAGIPVLTSDIAPPQTFAARFLRGVGEKTPITGTGPMRAAQQEARVSATRQLLDDYGFRGTENEINLIEQVSDSLMKARKENVYGLVAQKQNIIEKTSKAGSGPFARILPVSLSNTRRVIAGNIAELSKIPGDEPRRVAALLADLDQKISQYGGDMATLEKQRRAIGDQLERTGIGTISGIGAKAKNDVYAAVREDQMAHIAKYGSKDDLDKWITVNKKLAEMAKEKENFAQFQQALNQGTARTSAVTSMIRSQEPAVVEVLYRNLDDNGKKAMKAAIITDVARNVGGIDNVSPDKFLLRLSKEGKRLGVVFDEAEMRRLDTLKRALDVTKRAGEAAAMPPTGVQAVPFLAGATLVDLFGKAGAAVSVGTVGTISRMLESPAVRDLLVRMPSVKPGSRQELALAKQILVAADLALTGSQEQQQPSTQ